MNDEDDAVRVEVVRRGGFAGVTQHLVRDTEDLPAEEAARLRALVEAADLRVRLRLPGPTAHVFRYRVTVWRGGGRRRRHYTGLDLPPGVAELIEYVTGEPG